MVNKIKIKVLIPTMINKSRKRVLRFVWSDEILQIYAAEMHRNEDDSSEEIP